MGLKKLFKKNKGPKAPRGFHEVTLLNITKLTNDSVQISLDIPAELKSTYHFVPGQYLDFSIPLNDQNYRRSYSICSGPNEPISVAVKAVEGGTISQWFNTEVTEGSTLHVSAPHGSFIRTAQTKNIVAFAAGSGITPVLAIGKSLSADDQMHLFYGNKTASSTMFMEVVKELPQVKTQFIFSQEKAEDALYGRMDEQMVSEIIKSNLELLKADAFYLCGPNEMVEAITKKLGLFGVSSEKIKRELFTVPVSKSETASGESDAVVSDVTVFLDGEKINLNYIPKGKSIIELLDKEGYDPPYSCRGGVCSTCRATLVEGTARMRMNYVLTDEEVAQGSILCCQAEPTSEKVTISFDA